MESRSYLGIDPLLGEFRNHLRMTSTDMDAQLTAALKAAVNSAEHEISTVIAISRFTKECRFALVIPLMLPLVEVASVRVDGVPVSGDSYSVNDESGAICFDDSVSGSRVEIVYTAGFTVIPDDIKAAVFLLGGGLFNNPTDRPEERDRTSARNLLRPYRTWGER